MGGMVLDAKRLPDDRCHASRGPHIAQEAVRFRALGQQGGQVCPLLGRQLRLLSQAWPPSKRLAASCPRCLEPLAHRSAGHAQRLGDPNRFPARLIQLQRPQAPAFLPVVG